MPTGVESDVFSSVGTGMKEFNGAFVVDLNAAVFLRSSTHCHGDGLVGGGGSYVDGGCGVKAACRCVGTEKNVRVGVEDEELVCAEMLIGEDGGLRGTELEEYCQQQ